MSMTVLELGWGHYYAIPNEKVSKFLEIFDDMYAVDSVYVGDTNLVWYYKDQPRKLSMQIVNQFDTEFTANLKRTEYQEKTNGA